MRRFVVCAVYAASLMAGATVACAAELGSEIDLTAFGTFTEERAATWDDVPLREVARQLGTAPRRIYLSGMIGPSFARVTSPSDASLASDDTLFAAGGAIGIAFERARGRLRLELEGMGRDTYDAACAEPSPCSTILTNNWSVMQNVWRDIDVTDRFGIYGGGGIGAGGYILGDRISDLTEYASPAGNFAWQFGGGLLWQISDRLTFDVGYRYFHIDTIQQAALVSPNLFEASELMFTLRLYEPFRSWRR